GPGETGGRLAAWKTRSIGVLAFERAVFLVNAENTRTVLVGVAPASPDCFIPIQVFTLHEGTVFAGNNPAGSSPNDATDRHRFSQRPHILRRGSYNHAFAERKTQSTARPHRRRTPCCCLRGRLRGRPAGDRSCI